MKKSLVVGCTAILAAVFALSGQTPNVRQTAAKTAIPSADAEYALLDQYCMTCHYGKDAPAGLQMEKLEFGPAGQRRLMVGR